jgi:DNA-binding transcriptional ArsR family regulator
MSSDKSRKPDAPVPAAPVPAVLQGRGRPDAVSDATSVEMSMPTGDLAAHKVTDARAMRALAHPVRLALLEALAHAGTLTATQASELLGESPANCAFHLRTLAKYGYVVEAGGGRGRERPWRRAHTVLQITSEQQDPAAAMAADELSQYWMDTLLERARSALTRRGSWPAEWRHNPLLGENQSIIYATRQEAAELGTEIYRLMLRFEDRVDHPERRPADALPIESVLISYPLLHLASRPVPGAGDAAPDQPQPE